MQQLHVSSLDATALAYAERGFDPHILLNLVGTQQSWPSMLSWCGVNMVIK